jgi:hypothetical protein
MTLKAFFRRYRRAATDSANGLGATETDVPDDDLDALQLPDMPPPDESASSKLRDLLYRMSIGVQTFEVPNPRERLKDTYLKLGMTAREAADRALASGSEMLGLRPPARKIGVVVCAAALGISAQVIGAAPEAVGYLQQGSELGHSEPIIPSETPDPQLQPFYD